MNPPPGGRPAHHRRTMELLASARPASLDPPPGEDRRAVTLAAVLDAPPQGDPTGGVHPPGRPQGRPERRRLRHPKAALGAGLTLATAAACVAILLATDGLTPGIKPPAGPPTAARPSPRHTAVASLTAQQILLTAAVSAAKQPSQGRYWRVQDVNGSVEAAGPNAHPYAVEQVYAPETSWDARSPQQRSWEYPSTGYTTRPATKGAAAAWRAAGSPRLSRQHGRQQAWYQYGGTGYFGNASPAFAQIQRLPASPARLAAAVKKAAEQQIEPTPHVSIHYWATGGKQSLIQAMFGVYDQLLKLDPISPQVRAAVYRDLALLPGVHSVGEVTDPLGRTGYGIAQSQGPANSGTQRVDEVLVIAPGSGLLLTDEFIVTGTSYRPPASGAAPGLASCPKGTALPRHHGNPLCQLSAAQAKRLLPASDGLVTTSRSVLVGTGPVAEQAPGQVQSFDAIVSAGWTNASPVLPPASQQFSVAKDSKG